MTTQLRSPDFPDLVFYEGSSKALPAWASELFTSELPHGEAG